MKIALSILLLAHGLFHLLGFVKAYGLSHIQQLSQPISKSMGLAWLVASLLFIAVSILMLLKKEWWPILAIIAVVVSQILMLIFWEDTKFGTIVNIVLLVISISAYGSYRFQQIARQEGIDILQNQSITTSSFINQDAIRELPLIVQKWMAFSGIIGQPKSHTVRIRQRGELKTAPNGKWMPFTAEQYINTNNPSYVWISHIKANSLLYMEGRDKLEKGKGQMLIKLYGLFPVVNEANNEKIDLGSLQRYLAEMCWFPSAALNDNVLWEAIGQNSAKATLKAHGKEVSGIFTFDHNGKITAFETRRYYGGDQDAKLETWHIEMLDFKEFEGIKIPNKCKVTWKLNDGNFNWLNLEIIELEYNKNQPW